MNKRISERTGATVLSIAMLTAAPAYAGIIDFASLGAAGEGAVTHVIDGNIYVQISGNLGTGYLDGVNSTSGLPSGLGECQTLNSDGSCAPTTDDNVTEGEQITLSFFANDNGTAGDALLVSVFDLVFRGELHNLVGDPGADIQANNTLLFGADGSLNEFTYADSLTAIGNSVTFAYGGSDPNQFYISSVTLQASEVPEPMALGFLLFGIGALSLRNTFKRPSISWAGDSSANAP